MRSTPARRLVFSYVAVAALLLPAAAEAAREYDLPAQIYYEQDVSSADPVVDPGRCFVGVFVEFPTLRRAKGYRIELDVVGERREYIAPPFESSQWTIKYPPASGFARFFVGGYSTGNGCAEALALTAGRATIVEAR